MRKCSVLNFVVTRLVPQECFQFLTHFVHKKFRSFVNKIGMFSLLPKEEKDTIRREYRIRLSVVVLCFSFVTALLASIMILPAYSLSTKKERATIRESETLIKSVKAEEALRFGDILSEVKRKLTLVPHTPPLAYLYEVVTVVAEKRVSGISLTNITFTKNGSRWNVVLGGVADTRTALVDYQKALAKEEIFEAVEFPVANLAKDSNSEFSITAKGIF